MVNLINLSFFFYCTIIQTTLKVIHKNMSSQAQNSQTDSTHTPNQKWNESRALASFAKNPSTKNICVYMRVYCVLGCRSCFANFSNFYFPTYYRYCHFATKRAKILSSSLTCWMVMVTVVVVGWLCHSLDICNVNIFLPRRIEENL